MGTPACAACQGEFPACIGCMRRIRIVFQPREEQSMRLFIGDDVASRPSPLLWPPHAPLVRHSAPPAPASHTYLGVVMRAPPVHRGRPGLLGGEADGTCVGRVSPRALAIVARGDPPALAIIVARKPVVTARVAWLRASVRGLAKLVHLARLVPHARIATATLEARLRNGCLRAAFAMDRLALRRPEHLPCEWCGLPTTRRCATCEVRRRVICMDCAFVFLGCTCCWIRHRGQAPPPADADALLGWYPR